MTIDVTQPLDEALATIPAVFRTSDNHGATWDGGNTDQGWLYVDSQGNLAGADRADFRVRAEIIRDSVQYALSGTTIQVTASFRYRLHAQKRFQVAFVTTWPGGYCGNNNTATIPLVIAGASSLELTPRWELRSHTQLGITRLDDCVITIGPLRTPPGLIDAVRPIVDRLVLQPVASRIDSQIASLDVRSKLAVVWQKLQQPTAIRSLWLALHPESFVVDAIAVSGTSSIAPHRAVVTATAGLLAHPVVSRTRPDADTEVLPDARPSAGGGVFVETLLDLPYRELASVLTPALGEIARTVEIRGVEVHPAGSGQLAVDVAFALRGDEHICGRATLVGRPAVDVVAQSVSFPDLDFVATTNSTLVNAYMWLARAGLRDKLRAAVTTSWARPLAALQSDLVQAGAAHHIQLKVDRLAIEGVELRSSMTIVAVLSGAMKLDPVLLDAWTVAQ